MEAKKPNLYLAGPMSGYPELNHKAFFEYAEAFEEGGWSVFNPAQNDCDQYGNVQSVLEAIDIDVFDGLNTTIRSLLGADLDWICYNADAIAMMPGWENSKGARAEHATAVALGLQIIYLD